MFYESCKTRFSGGLGPKLGGATDLHRGVFPHRFVKFDDGIFFVDNAAELIDGGQIGRQARSDFVNVSRAERDHPIAGLESISDFKMKCREIGMGKRFLGFTAFFNGVDDGLTGNSGNRLLAGRVNIGDPQFINFIKSRAKFIAQQLRPREAMRLEKANEVALMLGSGGLKGRLDFCGVMPVIIDDCHKIRLTFQFKATFGSTKTAERFIDLID